MSMPTPRMSPLELLEKQTVLLSEILHLQLRITSQQEHIEEILSKDSASILIELKKQGQVLNNLLFGVSIIVCIIIASVIFNFW
jgi:hypothetical protein